MGLFFVALSYLKTPDAQAVAEMDGAIQTQCDQEESERRITSSDGETFCYTVCNRTKGRLIAGLGALFMGMISTGLGELNDYFPLRRCRVPSKVSVATSVFVVAITALGTSSGHVLRFAHAGRGAWALIVPVILFTVPGVFLGGQLGSRVARRLSQRALERGLGILLILVGMLMLGDALW